MNTTNVETTSSIAASRPAAAILVAVAFATGLADFLFWRGGYGLSVGVLFAGLALMLLASLRQRPRARVCAIVAMLSACCVQSAIEVSASNILASVALTLALAGEIFQPHLAGLWARLSEVAFGLLTAPLRWFRIAGTVTREVAGQRLAGFSVAVSAVRAAWVIGPAVILLGVFAILFGKGNAVFANIVTHAETNALGWIANLDLSPARFLFWAFAATVALGIFHGTRAPDSPRWWLFTFPRLARPDNRLAVGQSAAVLLALNALFCVVNTIDAIYLWSQTSLPVGVHRSAFVHDGVTSLSVAVVLSAIIIAGIFQQEDRVAENRWLKNLAHLWVVQNFILIAGVLLRLKFYSDDYMLTEKRIYVACFLALVASGFAVLAWFVEKRRTFNWLLGRNAVAAFFLFFALQFTDVAEEVAHYNVARWTASLGGRKPKTLDIEYLASLGPGAWPHLKIVAASERASSVVADAKLKLNEIRAQEASAATVEDWRDWQWRRAQARVVLQARP